MPRTVSLRFRNGTPVSALKDPRQRREAEAVGQAFLDNPGERIVVVNPELPEEAREAARALLVGAIRTGTLRRSG